jgi:hypothetical protein
MTATAITTTNINPAGARKRLGELRDEKAALSQRQQELQQRIVAGRSQSEVAALADRLIAGEPTDEVVQDVQAMANAVQDQLDVIVAAERVLDRVVLLDDLRTTTAAARPSFDRAVAVVRRLDAALAAVEKVCKEAAAAVLAFDHDYAGAAALQDRFPEEPRPLDVMRLVPLRQWPLGEFVELHGANASHFRRWHAEANSLGAL